MEIIIIWYLLRVAQLVRISDGCDLNKKFYILKGCKSYKRTYYLKTNIKPSYPVALYQVVSVGFVYRG